MSLSWGSCGTRSLTEISPFWGWLSWVAAGVPGLLETVVAAGLTGAGGCRVGGCGWLRGWSLFQPL